MNNFNAGDYVVLLASCDGKDCWHNAMPINHCYQLRLDSSDLRFYVAMDMNGSTTNGWTGDWQGSHYLILGYSFMRLRKATQKEIDIYLLMGPFKVPEISMDRFLKNIWSKD